MSLYYEAAAILVSTHKGGGSIKSLVYGVKTHKSDPKTLFALVTQAAKWSEVLSEVIDRSEILKNENQLSATMAIVLIHDFLLSKRGIALPQTHGLTTTIAKYKARLSAELIKARLRRGCASLDQLRERIEGDRLSSGGQYPRWVRINQLKSTLGRQMSTTFADYTKTESLQDVTKKAPHESSKAVYVDYNVPNLVAIPSNTDIATSRAYKMGEIIFQDKASCFPAYLLDPATLDGDVIDACAAPGNKTTHVAALLSQRYTGQQKRTASVIACEKDATRSLTLQKMVKLADGERIIRVRSKQDFMKLDPQDSAFAKVTALLLDPSCSGSGIVGRDEASVTVHLPGKSTSSDDAAPKSKKRKRSSAKPASLPAASPEEATIEEVPMEEADQAKLQDRLSSLAAFQLRIVQHAMTFASAQRITYSTCSVHAIENEHVVIKALCSAVAKERGWRIMRREEQVEGLRRWKGRGSLNACHSCIIPGDDETARLDMQVIAEACIRCDKGTEDGTMGFFVAGLVRDVGSKSNGHKLKSSVTPDDDSLRGPSVDDSEEEWNGFEHD